MTREHAIRFTSVEVAKYYSIRAPHIKQTKTAQWRGSCPIHSGTRASFSIDAGTGRWFCHSQCNCGGDLVDFEEALTGCDFQRAKAEIFRLVGRSEDNCNGSGRRIVAEYNYTDANGALLYQVCRTEPKGFFQRTPDGHGSWINRGPRDEDKVLYHLPEVIAAPIVFVVEGEKDVKALTELGVAATTNVGGAGKWRREYAQFLRAKQVFVIPDADEKGRKHAEDVMRSLDGVATAQLLELPGAKDAAEWIARGGTLEKLAALEEQHKTAPVAHVESAPPEAGTLITRRVSDVEARPIRWLWAHRVPRGKLTILAGFPGLGKSQLTAYLAARVTAGGVWPDGGGKAPGGAQAVILTAEDDTADTLRPRLEAAGADLERVHIVDGVIRGYSGDGTRHQRMFSLESDLAALDTKLTELKQVELVIVDPISAYLGNIDSHVNAEVRGALGPVKELAESHGAAFVAVSHMSKAGGPQALLRVTGSLAFIAAARAGYLVAADPQNAERMLFLPLKINIARQQPGLAFHIETANVSSAAGDIETSRVVWEDAPVTVTADEVMSQSDPEEASALKEARDWLKDTLADGPVSSAELQRQAKAQGISTATLRRAKKSLKVRATKRTGPQGGWNCELEDAQDAQELRGTEVSTLPESTLVEEEI
jgi:5S rRNA maturation endonuclease (ribonuclease M5)